MNIETRSYRDGALDSIRISLELTDGCNLDCVHCFKTLNKTISFLKVALIENLLDQLHTLDLGTRVTLTGGEPTLHPELAAIMSAICERGFPVSVITNGWNFQRVLPVFEEFRDGIEVVTFSLDGAIAETHDTVRRQGSFRKVVNALEWCRLHELNTQINMVVTKSNHGELNEMVGLATSLGCRALGLAHCKITPDAVSQDLVMDLRGRRQLEADITALQRTFRLPILLAGDHFDPHPIALCPQLQLRELHIDVFGRLTACCELSAYRGGRDENDIVADLTETPIREALRLLADRTAVMLRAKADMVASGEATEIDYFICTQCLRHYRKVAHRFLQPADPDSQGPT